MWSNLKPVHKIVAAVSTLSAFGMLAGALYLMITQSKKDKRERSSPLIILGLILSAVSAALLLGTALVLVLFSANKPE